MSSASKTGPTGRISQPRNDVIREYQTLGTAAQKRTRVETPLQVQPNVRSNSPAIAALPSSVKKRVPVPQKCGCAITGSATG